MITRALDLLRTLGWLLLDFIFGLIDNLYDILKSLNGFNIIDSIAKNTIFSNFHSGVLAIALTLLGLFALWRFIMKMIEPDEGLSVGQIIKEIIKCTVLIILSTFLFAEASTFSIKLAGYTSNALKPKDMTIGESMLSMYVNYEEDYKKNSSFENKNIEKLISSGEFKNKSMYNDKYTTDSDSDTPNEEKYQYKINWIIGVVIGAFFLYAIFFSGMMLARRQIEFLFLFVISPIVFATSIGNKQRRGAVIEQMTSLMLQGAVIMLIIALTATVMGEINNTVFFPKEPVQNTLLKSLLFLGCASFLLTGSQVINRFIGNNVSANSGREQMMAMMGFGQAMSGAAKLAGLGGIGAGLFASGAGANILGKSGGNSIINKLGSSVEKLGSRLNENKGSPIKSSIGNTIERFGGKMKNQTPSNIGKNMMNLGRNSISSALNIKPLKTNYRKRYGRGDD